MKKIYNMNKQINYMQNKNFINMQII